MPTKPGSISHPPVPVPDWDRAKIDAHSLHIVIVEEYSNGQFKLGTRYILTLVWNKISKLSINLDTHWGCRIVWYGHCPENISRGTFAENKLRNGLIKPVVNVGVIHLLILIVLHSDDIEDRCLVWPLSQSSMYWHFPLLGPCICWLFIYYYPNSFVRFTPLTTPLIWTTTFLWKGLLSKGCMKH